MTTLIILVASKVNMSNGVDAFDIDLRMKSRRHESKAGWRPMANVAINPEKGYEFTEVRELLKRLMANMSDS
jgi:hypothetical protein